VRNFRTVKVVYWVNVSHGSGVGSPWLCVKVDYISRLLTVNY